MLKKSGTQVNDLSDQLSAEIQKKIDKLGKEVKFKFHISRKNPDGMAQGTKAEFLYPSYWELKPITYDIIDPGDKKRKKLGLFIQEINFGNNRIELQFDRIVLKERDRGILVLKTDKPDDIDKLGYLFQHPEFGKVFDLIDETKEAKRKVSIRSDRRDALIVASNMSAQEVKDFAAARGWDENEEDAILQDRIQEMAENDTENFKNFMNETNISYRAVVTRAENNQIIEWNATEFKYVWASSRELIAAFGRQDKDRLDLMTDWLLTSKHGEEIFNKLKGMLKSAKAAF